VAEAAVRSAQPLEQVNVSNDTGVQAEVAVALDPTNDQVLLAGSNSIALSALGSLARVYGSNDGGATWTSRPGPAAARLGDRRACDYGDPTVAIDRGGRQYYGFLAAACIDFSKLETGEELTIPSLEVATRAGAAGAWRSARVFPSAGTRFDDKPAIAVDTSSASPYADRVYVAWTRIRLRGPNSFQGARGDIVVSRSDDHGETWSRPVVVTDRQNLGSTFASLAVDRAGRVYVAWTDAQHGIWIDSSDSGGDRFGRDVKVDAAVFLPGGHCSERGQVGVPAQSRRCITPTPAVSVDDRAGRGERIYVTYAAAGHDGREQDVFAAALDSQLRPLLAAPQQVNPPDTAAASDQFMPAAAVDPGSGRLWVCFYDTSGDRRRERVFYSCTASSDGGATWARPVRAATVPSKEAARGGLALLSDFQFGDYQGLAVANGVAHPIWTDTRDRDVLSEEIYTTVLTDAQLQSPQP